MQQLTLSRPLSPTRILALPDRPRVPRNAPIGLESPGGLKPAGTLKPGVSPRKRLTLPLRPVQSLLPRPAVARPPVHGRELPCGAVAFIDAAQAWFWTVNALSARHGGARPGDRNPGNRNPGDRSRRNPNAINPDQAGEPEGNRPMDTLAPLRLTRAPEQLTFVKIPRPCDPDDIIRAISLLHQRGDITLSHARVLRRWGDAGRAPDPAHPKQTKDLALWTEALTRLEVLLREKSIVATM